METVQPQVLEATPKVAPPRLGISHKQPTPHVHLLPPSRQLVRGEVECHQVAEPVIPAPWYLSGSPRTLGPDLALSQEYREYGRPQVRLVGIGKLEQQAIVSPGAQEEGYGEVGARRLGEQEGDDTRGVPQAKSGRRKLCRERQQPGET